MSFLFFVEALIYILFTILLSVKTVDVFTATITWRIMGVVSIVGVVLSAYVKMSSQTCSFIFISLLQCFALVPLLSPCSVCNICGKRIYWKPLISNRCPCCGKVLFK